MSPTEILSMFASKSDVRKWMLRPFRLNGFVYATNGHWMVRISDEPTIDADPIADHHPKSIEKMFAEAPTEGFISLPEMEKPADCTRCEGLGFGTLTKCESCDGDGEFVHCGHFYECKACDGEGDSFEATPDGTDACPDCYGRGLKAWGVPGQSVGIAKFSPVYLWMLRVLPGIQIAVNDKDGKARFTFEGGEGLLMPYRD